MRTLSRFTDMFRDPVTNRELVGDEYHMYLGRPLVSFNSLYLNREMARIPEQATTVYFHVTEQVTLIDHTSSFNLTSFARDYERHGRGQVHFPGLDDMFMCSTDETCVRLGALSLTGGAKGGISALYAKASQSLFGVSRPMTWTPSADSDRASAPPHFASDSSNDLAFLSLSTSCGDNLEVRDPDVTCLGPKPAVDPASELDRLSLSWERPRDGSTVID
jgi:hypothetical protein